MPGSKSWLLTLDGMEVTIRLTYTECEMTRLTEVDVFSQCIRQGIGMVGADNAESRNRLADGGILA
jgi:hypothetical protein